MVMMAPHQRLAFDGSEQIVITEPGYVYIYISNENGTPAEVYFDDFKVTHAKSPIVQSMIIIQSASLLTFKLIFERKWLSKIIGTAEKKFKTN
jgi:hypothetical protein